MVKQIENFLTPEQCQGLIKMIDDNHQRSSVVDAGEERSGYSETRTSSTSNLKSTDPLVQEIHQKIADYLGYDIKRGEHLQGQLYEPGQYFRPHTDYFDGPSYNNHCLASGNRVHTLMIYLNEPEEGGETDFPQLGIKIKPKTGTAVVWPNMLGGQVLPEMIHEGTDVIKGKKYIITSWWRENIWDGSGDARLAAEYHLRQREKDRAKLASKTFSSPEDLPRFSPNGFKVIKCPEESWNIIKDAYEILKNNIREEIFDGKNSIIPGEGNTSDIMSFDHLSSIRSILHRQLLPAHEKFCGGEPIEPSFIYGIRSYNKGASLSPHVDRIATHHISSIIIVDKDLGDGKDWPLDIQGHDGKWHKVYTEPGDMILYESAICEHARKELFEGNYFRNFYVHYKLKDWTYVGG